MSQEIIEVSASTHIHLTALMGAEHGVLDEHHLTDLLRIARCSLPESELLALIKAINGFDTVFVRTLIE